MVDMVLIMEYLKLNLMMDFKRVIRRQVEKLVGCCMGIVNLIYLANVIILQFSLLLELIIKYVFIT
jgi:hypothetical protein